MLAVASADVEAAVQAIQAHLDSSLDDHARQRAHAVADFDGETVNCPACGTEFEPSLRRCPDCDLNFGA